ncbi:MAG TPA: biopolymer transporter ExbD [Polyangiaceae bacterium]|nr:biopolymer transporter ExbD [Polyangiaceae bacterium]
MDVGPKGLGRGRAQPNMNVTPLVDVVLVLLIIFMVVAPLLAKQFWLHVPNKVEKDRPSEPDDKDRPIVIFATRSGEIRINREVVREAEFPAKLRRVLAARGQRTVFFDAEDEAEFGSAVDVLDQARAGGAAEIAVLTTPIADHSGSR